MDVLNVRGNIHPGRYLEIVQGLDALSVAWTKNGLRKRAELIAGSYIIPTDAELIATLLSDGAIAANSRTEKVSNGSWIRIADGRTPEQAVATLLLVVELDQVLIEAVVDCVGIRESRKSGDGWLRVNARGRLGKPQVSQINMLPHTPDVMITFQVEEIGVYLHFATDNNPG